MTEYYEMYRIFLMARSNVEFVTISGCGRVDGCSSITQRFDRCVVVVIRV